MAYVVVEDMKYSQYSWLPKNSSKEKKINLEGDVLNVLHINLFIFWTAFGHGKLTNMLLSQLVSKQFATISHSHTLFSYVWLTKTSAHYFLHQLVANFLQCGVK